jgi:DNA-binding CsgD family transcriptional regulator
VKSTIPADLPPLWEKLASFGAADADAALEHLLQALGAHVQSDCGYWLGAVRMTDSPADDVLSGWRPLAIRWIPEPPDGRNIYKEARAEIDRGEPDASTIEHTRRAGQFRALRLRDLMPPEWFATPYFDRMYTARGVCDVVWVICPVGADAEAYYAWFRRQGQPHFSEDDRDWLAAAVLGIPWFHRMVMLRYGLHVAARPLTETERRVMPLLLSKRSEKEIAAELGLAPRTTHHHITSIFRKFGVTGRTALLARWLGA